MEKINVYLISALLFGANILLAQPYPKTYHTTFANSYNAGHGVAGAISSYNRSPILKNQLSAFSASGLWVGAFERTEMRLKTAVTTYHTGGYDFVAGPLDLNKNEAERTALAKQYDKIWLVTAAEILQHQEDFKDGKIDNPMPNIMAWPAKGNPNFEAFNFFKNDYDSQDLAPFKDINNDGVYTPLQGDFPFIQQVDAAQQPDEIFWSIFNDHSSHTNSKGRPLDIEIQQTGWAFNCSENSILNNTNFLSFKVLNKGKTALDSVFIGYWNDYDCTEDLIGVSPTNNAFFAYNSGDSSKFCYYPTPKYSSISFLNKPMYSFVNYNDNAVSTPPPATTDPNNVIDFYRYMNAQWKDGTPMTRDGTGYNPNSKDYTKFMFDGNPNDSSTWSMKTANLPKANRKVVGSFYINSLASNESVTLDIALTSHYDTSKKTNKSQIDNMYANFSKLQSAYNQHFTGKCTLVKCQNDCVFPGDANNDGRADEKDFLTIVQFLNKKGKARNNSVFWEAKTNEDWEAKTNFGINLKHTDCDGNGTIEETGDKAVLVENFLKTHAKFQVQPDIFLHNDEIQLGMRKGVDSLSINSLASSLGVTLSPNLTDNDAFAYSFELDFDRRFFKSISAANQGNFLKIIEKNQVGNIHFASSRIAKQVLSFSFSEEAVNTQKVPTPCTELHFKNIQAIRADGSIISNIGAKDVKLCFNDLLVKAVDSKPYLEGIYIYPNPFSDYLIIENKNLQVIDYQLFDIQGKGVGAGKIDAENQAFLVTDFLPRGIYLLKIKTPAGQFLPKKIVKTD